MGFATPIVLAIMLGAIGYILDARLTRIAEALEDKKDEEESGGGNE